MNKNKVLVKCSWCERECDKYGNISVLTRKPFCFECKSGYENRTKYLATSPNNELLDIADEMVEYILKDHTNKNRDVIAKNLKKAIKQRRIEDK